MLFLTFLMLAPACSTASDLQKDATSAQKEANKTITAAAKEATTDAKAAQAKADADISAAGTAFQSMRENYRHSSKSALVDLDAQIAKLEAAAVKATGKEKADRNGRLDTMRANRAAFMTEYDAMESVDMSAWDAARARADARWETFKTSVAAG